MDPSSSVFPTSFAQRRLWFIHRMSPQSTAYNMLFTTPLPGATDVNALQWALNALVARHESLRTSFEFTAGAPVQVIAPRGELPLHTVALAERAELRGVLSQLVASPFDQPNLSRVGEGDVSLIDRDAAN